MCPGIRHAPRAQDVQGKAYALYVADPCPIPSTTRKILSTEPRVSPAPQWLWPLNQTSFVGWEVFGALTAVLRVTLGTVLRDYSHQGIRAPYDFLRVEPGLARPTFPLFYVIYSLNKPA